MKKIAVLVIFAVVLTLSSCDDFFSKSWGTQRTYNTSKINVNAGNVDDWIKASAGNPALAKAVAEAILKKLPAVNDAEKKILLGAGLRLAVESSGVGELLLSEFAKQLKNTDIDNFDETTIENILDKIVDDFNKGGGADAAELIGQIAGEFIDDKDGTPKFDEEYIDSLKSGDVAEAILVLILNELGNSGASIENWDDIENLTLGLVSDGYHIQVGDPENTTPGSIALAAYINLIIDHPEKFQDNPFTDIFKDAFV